MDIHKSGEDYLEVILFLKEKKGAVRSVDIVEERGFSKSSVSRAVNILKDRGFIEIEQSGEINFTNDGFARAKEIAMRHKLLSEFLIKLGVDKKIAEEDACKIEHDISVETFEAIKKHSNIKVDKK